MHLGRVGSGCCGPVFRLCPLLYGAVQLCVNNGSLLCSCSVVKDGLGASCYKGQGLVECFTSSSATCLGGAVDTWNCSLLATEGKSSSSRHLTYHTVVTSSQLAYQDEGLGQHFITLDNDYYHPMLSTTRSVCWVKRKAILLYSKGQLSKKCSRKRKTGCLHCMKAQDSVLCLQAAAGGGVTPLGRQAKLWGSTGICPNLSRNGWVHLVWQRPILGKNTKCWARGFPAKPTENLSAHPHFSHSFLLFLPGLLIPLISLAFSHCSGRDLSARGKRCCLVYLRSTMGGILLKSTNHRPILPNPLITVYLTETGCRASPESSGNKAKALPRR